MALGIGAIVFLVSIGYGLEKLVITRVARLEEIKQIDIAPAVASNININDMTIATFESISNVAQVLPVIGVVGTVNYQKSSTDVAVYGVLSDYLKSSALQATRGKFFENNDRSVLVSAQYASSAREPTIASDSAQTDFTDESLVEEGNVVATKQTDDQRTIDLPYNHTREAVVNASLLSVLGLSEKDSLGKTFQISFVATDGLVASGERQITSTSVEYTIIGILPKAKTPVIYVPITDLKQLGVSNYSNVKLVVSDPKKLPVVRSNIEGLGFKTMSVVDTVSQIERLFASARLFLWLVGMVGLGVAVLGMFNTLTVSLLERTREIGMMKALGMRSEEVRELLLTDSMTMSFLGGVLGLMLGYAGGKVVSLVLSVFVITKNMGILNVSSIPSSFAFLILGLSLIVGVLTGLYPAYRATRISALDALRYE